MVYDNYSLFHHFADNVDVIQQIHDGYLESVENDKLSAKEKNMPLVILNPDNQGMTALDWAL